MGYAPFALLLLPWIGLLGFPPAAQELCPADEIDVVARADTVFVTHGNAEFNCCLLLDLAFVTGTSTIDFFEGSTGEACRCDCCLDLQYSACGFPAGHYTVRLWNGDGSQLHGSREIDIEGGQASPNLLAIDQGPCRTPTPSTPATWWRVKKLFR